MMTSVLRSSSPDVGSSRRRIFGSLMSARAMLARCCCPPDIDLGNLFLNSASPSRVRYLLMFADLCLLGMPARAAARFRFLLMEARGRRLSCWNTNPRSFLLNLVLLERYPWMFILPFCCLRYPPMTLRRVDFPHPEKPLMRWIPGENS